MVSEILRSSMCIHAKVLAPPLSFFFSDLPYLLEKRFFTGSAEVATGAAPGAAFGNAYY